MVKFKSLNITVSNWEAGPSVASTIHKTSAFLRHNEAALCLKPLGMSCMAVVVHTPSIGQPYNLGCGCVVGC